jgi:hypothetical protein
VCQCGASVPLWTRTAQKKNDLSKWWLAIPILILIFAILGYITNSRGGSGLVGGLLLVALCFIGLAIYLLPSIIGFKSKKRNAGAIFALNLLLGWSFIGWVLALVWALNKDVHSL